MTVAPGVEPTAALLRALVLDEPDDDATRALAGGSPFPWLFRAAAHLERGRRASARRDVERGLALAGPRAPARLLAGALFFLTHDYQRALDLFGALRAQTGDVGRQARELGWQTARALGWDHDARRWLEDNIAFRPGDVALRAERVRLALRGDDLESALAHARAAAGVAKASATLQMQLATLAAAQREDEAAIAAAERALSLAPADRRLLYLRAAADVAIQIGDFARATGWLEAAAEEGDGDSGALVRLAELAAWRDDPASARALARAALDRNPRESGARRVLGALHACAGELDEAERLLAETVSLDAVDAEAHLWRGEVAFRAGRRSDAEAHLHLATSTAPGHRCAAWMVRTLLVLDDATTLDAAGLVPPTRLEEFVDALRELSPSLGPRAIASRTRADTALAVEDALRALRGNRSPQPTHVIDGKLTRLRATGGCRYDARAALQLLRVADPQVSLRALDRLVAHHPASALPLCHRGELQLWLGDLSAAKRDLEGALAIGIGTRWAYMGLATLALLAGDPTASLAINARGVSVMGGTEGPGIHVFRGEAYRLLNRLDEALVELQRATTRHPGRVSATVNLALVHGARGERADEIALFRRLAHEDAAGLLSDAAAELGVMIVGDGDWLPDAGTRASVLTRALAMMRGNRSSNLVTYWHDQKLRLVPPPGQGARPHDLDVHRLIHAREAILGAWRAAGR